MNGITFCNRLLAVILCCWVSVAAAEDERFKPFVLASNEPGDLGETITATKSKLESAGFSIAGEYTPYDGAHIIVVTNAELKKAAASHSRGGYIAAQRVALTDINDKIQVSYTYPYYMAKMYRIESDLKDVNDKLKQALGFVEFFGPDKGVKEKQLGKYRYMFGMERFDDPYELATHESHEKALETVEKNLAANISGVSKIYRIDIPGTQQVLFGVGFKGGTEDDKDQDDKYIMSEIDFKDLRSTAHLPYELLVNGKEVEALHARFRIAINFPDLSMMGSNSFMNIMSTPKALYKALTAVAGGEG
ncbi:MAG: hypothetical protein LJE85_01860 [Gammaproteobacteria bacterium]|jgi:hypothetical protein|nr:hypothetical protein [Gammaproteobacteria bacterium]